MQRERNAKVPIYARDWGRTVHQGLKEPILKGNFRIFACRFTY
jgi:hypothetical protein